MNVSTDQQHDHATNAPSCAFHDDPSTTPPMKPLQQHSFHTVQTHFPSFPHSPSSHFSPLIDYDSSSTSPSTSFYDSQDRPPTPIPLKLWSSIKRFFDGFVPPRNFRNPPDFPPYFSSESNLHQLSESHSTHRSSADVPVRSLPFSNSFRRLDRRFVNSPHDQELQPIPNGSRNSTPPYNIPPSTPASSPLLKQYTASNFTQPPPNDRNRPQGFLGDHGGHPEPMHYYAPSPESLSFAPQYKKNLPQSHSVRSGVQSPNYQTTARRIVSLPESEVEGHASPVKCANLPSPQSLTSPPTSVIVPPKMFSNQPPKQSTSGVIKVVPATRKPITSYTPPPDNGGSSQSSSSKVPIKLKIATPGSNSAISKSSHVTHTKSASHSTQHANTPHRSKKKSSSGNQTQSSRTLKIQASLQLRNLSKPRGASSENQEGDISLSALKPPIPPLDGETGPISPPAKAHALPDKEITKPVFSESSIASKLPETSTRTHSIEPSNTDSATWDEKGFEGKKSLAGSLASVSPSTSETTAPSPSKAPPSDNTCDIARKHDDSKRMSEDFDRKRSSRLKPIFEETSLKEPLTDNAKKSVHSSVATNCKGAMTSPKLHSKETSTSLPRHKSFIAPKVTRSAVTPTSPQVGSQIPIARTQKTTNTSQRLLTKQVSEIPTSPKTRAASVTTPSQLPRKQTLPRAPTSLKRVNGGGSKLSQPIDQHFSGLPKSPVPKRSSQTQLKRASQSQKVVSDATRSSLGTQSFKNGLDTPKHSKSDLIVEASREGTCIKQSDKISESAPPSLSTQDERQEQLSTVEVEKTSGGVQSSLRLESLKNHSSKAIPQQEVVPTQVKLPETEKIRRSETTKITTVRIQKSIIKENNHSNRSESFSTLTKTKENPQLEILSKSEPKIDTLEITELEESSDEAEIQGDKQDEEQLQIHWPPNSPNSPNSATVAISSSPEKSLRDTDQTEKSSPSEASVILDNLKIPPLELPNVSEASIAENDELVRGDWEDRKRISSSRSHPFAFSISPMTDTSGPDVTPRRMFESTFCEARPRKKSVDSHVLSDSFEEDLIEADLPPSIRPTHNDLPVIQKIRRVRWSELRSRFVHAAGILPNMSTNSLPSIFSSPHLPIHSNNCSASGPITCPCSPYLWSSCPCMSAGASSSLLSPLHQATSPTSPVTPDSILSSVVGSDFVYSLLIQRLAGSLKLDRRLMHLQRLRRQLRERVLKKSYCAEDADDLRRFQLFRSRQEERRQALVSNQRRFDITLPESS